MPAAKTSKNPAKAARAAKAAPAAAPADSVADAPAEAPPRKARLRAVDTAADAAAAPADKPARKDRRRTDLADAVVAGSALKRPEAKAVVALLMTELGQALDRDGTVNLPGLGKLSLKKRQTDKNGTEVMTLRLKRQRQAAAADGETPLADPGEDG
jgi:nucleoid DNA-binding protein